MKRVILPALRLEGFVRGRGRDLLRLHGPIVHRLYFQVSSFGDRQFCTTVCANLVAAHDFPTLSPGFRLKRDTDGGDLWLPSSSPAEAERSTQVLLSSIMAEALPWLEGLTTPEGYARLRETVEHRRDHHQCFEAAIAWALAGDEDKADRNLHAAINLYQVDGRVWCEAYIVRAEALRSALSKGQAAALLADWDLARRPAQGIRT
ncbi:hypothetical protein JKL49_09265 [Phenylobacterium sp. 20VBR1]|uniref:DUF4304 domain-containing protein n=1 Tax=Phenylobacterium glaciei TaxID=2803784 RepID=A0A941HWI9_9CAUL|nr:DUF4304 domain-containing protein [Phenylobacterium glaciei]MBR7619575.1 hypothetical protein [Phenylobacterium glaciei]